MNWFKETQPEPMIKSAYSRPSSPTDETAFFAQDSDGSTSPNQVGTYAILFDIQRYVMDSYTTKIAMSKTNNKFGIALMTNHNFLGTIAWDEYWTYGLDEFDQARDTYDKLNVIVSEVSQEFAMNETPTSIFWPTLRSRIEMEIDPGKRNHTNIPVVNYARQVTQIAPDWRSNIYGNRYPDYVEANENQYVKFWATQTGN
tara:strand:- start:5115 stop:5714 length:600 start_codon:yes stop_codon:yes gene_type:complete